MTSPTPESDFQRLVRIIETINGSQIYQWSEKKFAIRNLEHCPSRQGPVFSAKVLDGPTAVFAFREIKFYDPPKDIIDQIKIIAGGFCEPDSPHAIPHILSLAYPIFPPRTASKSRIQSAFVQYLKDEKNPIHSWFIKTMLSVLETMKEEKKT